jgi:CRP-like cAMP-binding protein
MKGSNKQMERHNSHLPLTECSLFSNLNPEDLKKINQIRDFRYLKKGDKLFSEGDIPLGIYCIHEGHIKCYKIGSDGKEQIIYLCKPGDIIGWQQLNCSDPYTTSAVSLEKALVSFIKKEDFLDLIDKFSLAAELTRYICDDVIMLESKVLELSQKSVRERLATNILMLHQKYSHNDGHKDLINIPLTREDFANLIGTNTETVIKLFSELRKDGHIDFIEKKIIVLNKSALQKFSDFYG